jgi:hypothetical protein
MWYRCFFIGRTTTTALKRQSCCLQGLRQWCCIPQRYGAEAEEVSEEKRHGCICSSRKPVRDPDGFVKFHAFDRYKRNFKTNPKSYDHTDLLSHYP